MSARLRVGLVGADAKGQGWAPLSHLPALRMLPQYELAAVCTAHADTAAAAAQTYGVSRAFHDYRVMVRDPEIDVVSVVVRVPNHHDIVMAALEAGKHVYCEWPLGANLAQAQAMADRARERKGKAIVGLQARGDPALRYLRDLAGDGYLGDIVAVSMSMFTGGELERPSSRLWDRDRTQGVSALTVRGMHTMDALCHCLGELVAVSARVTTQVTQWKVPDTGALEDVDAPDNGTVCGALAGGATVSVHVATVPYNASGFRLEIYGRKGTIVATTAGSPQRDAASLRGAQGADKLAPLPVPDRYLEMPPETPAGPPRNVGHLYLRLARAIRDDTAVDPDFDVALRRHQLIDAIQRASDEGCVQSVR